MASSTKQWGQTPPMSTSLPTQLDNDKNAELVEELKRENNYEPHEETQKRVEALKLLNKVVQEFIREAGRRQRMPQNQIDQLGGKIYPYGSYRLGVYGPGSDIDTLAVAPKNVTRDEFFKLLPDILYREAGKNKVASLTPVPDAFVPIIKLVLNDIEIDLIFASIASRSTIPRDLDLNENKILDGLDEGMLKSVTGPRVTDEILGLVPEQKTFRTALRAIKLWAQRRAIYANIVAYPGGVAWAMLVARVCQLYPHAVGGTLVQKFFGIMKAWKWPTPVLLKDIETGTHKTWNPKIYPSDAKNLMPIITPAYPSMCATFNIVQSTKTVISREVERGGKIADNIFNGTATWADLFKKHTFFTQDHKYYLSIIASATDPEEAKKWAGAVESKIRHLIALLESNKKLIALARPFTKGFKRTHKCENAEQLKAAKEGSMEYRIEEAKTIESTNPDILNTNGESTVPVDDSTTDGAVDSVITSSGSDTKILYTYTYYIGIDPTPTLEQTRQLDIAKEITAFRAKCYDWALAEQGKHELNIKPCKNFQLPDDLFEPGETKPSRPAKAKRKAPVTNGVGASEKGNGSVEPAAKKPAVEGPNGTPVAKNPVVEDSNGTPVISQVSTQDPGSATANGAEHALQPA